MEDVKQLLLVQQHDTLLVDIGLLTVLEIIDLKQHETMAFSISDLTYGSNPSISIIKVEDFEMVQAFFEHRLCDTVRESLDKAENNTWEKEKLYYDTWFADMQEFLELVEIALIYPQQVQRTPPIVINVNCGDCNAYFTQGVRYRRHRCPTKKKQKRT
jgi:hypothetical protein